MFNAAAWIGEALASAVAPEDVDLEVIVIDDGSTDDGATIVRERFPGARLVRIANAGVSRARNIGTTLATGDVLQYLDADDVLAPGKIARQIEVLERSHADVAYGDWQELVEAADGQFESGRLVKPHLAGEPDVGLFTSFWCPPAAYLFRRRIVQAVGGWHEALPIIQDARFAFDCAFAGGRFARSEGLAAYYRIQSAKSLSRRDSRAFVRDCLKNASEVEAIWATAATPGSERHRALLDAYGYVARASFAYDPETFEVANAALERLSPGGYRPRHPRQLAYAATIFGYRRAEALALRYRRIKTLLRRAA